MTAGVDAGFEASRKLLRRHRGRGTTAGVEAGFEASSELLRRDRERRRPTRIRGGGRARVLGALPDVTREERARVRQLEDHFAVLQHERWFEGVVRKLEDRFGNRPEWVEDAVATSFERAVRSEHVFASADELKRWLYVVAFNEMRGRAKREAGRPLPPWELERGHARSAEDEALDGILGEELHAELRDLIKRWPSARRRTVALFVLEMERAGEPCSGQDIADHVADIFGDVISIKAANRLRRLVLERLLNEVTGQPTDDEETDE